MIARAQYFGTVVELMQELDVGLNELVQSSGLDQRVIEAIMYQRYTPSPKQRERVSDALGVRREQLIWGHLNVVDEHIHAPI